MKMTVRKQMEAGKQMEVQKQMEVEKTTKQEGLAVLDLKKTWAQHNQLNKKRQKNLNKYLINYYYKSDVNDFCLLCP